MKINQAFTILQKAGGIRAARIITDNVKKLSYINVLWMAYQLKHGVPVAKIIHQKWFYGLKFYTNKHTLDPRPDTETLVASVIADCASDKNARILDLGTGTGCIISAIIKNTYGTTGIGLDKSWQAIKVAKKNVSNLGLDDKIQIIKQSFDNPNAVHEKFDIIVSNPPYIANGDNRVDIGALHDPKSALYAKDNGLACYKVIAKNSKNWIKNSGKIYLEIGIGQEIAVREIFANENWSFVRADNDLTGRERVLVFEPASY